MNMRDEEVRSARSVRAEGGVCIVMVCADMSEAEQVGRMLLQYNNACLITYRRVRDLVDSKPSGQVALIILATDHEPYPLARMLSWLRNLWPDSLLVVVGNEGSGQHEVAARSNGAIYFTRPVQAHEWSSVLTATTCKATAGEGMRSEGGE